MDVLAHAGQTCIRWRGDSIHSNTTFLNTQTIFSGSVKKLDNFTYLRNSSKDACMDSSKPDINMFAHPRSFS